MLQTTILRENIKKATKFTLHMGLVPNKNVVTVDRRKGVIFDDGKDITKKLKNIWENTALSDIVHHNESVHCGALVYALLLNQLDIEYIDKWLTNGTLVNIGNNHLRKELLSIGAYPHVDELPLTDKNKEIIKSFIYGGKLKTIGQKYGIGGERVRQIIVTGKRYFVNKCFIGE